MLKIAEILERNNLISLKVGTKEYKVRLIKAFRIILNFLYGLIIFGFIFWAGFFILKSSIVSFDKHRYFCLSEESMVSMRYATNLVKGNGLVFNKGEYVEGFSGLIPALFMAVPQKFLSKVKSVLFMQIISALFCLAIAFLSAKIATLVLGKKEPFVLLAFFSAFCYFPLDLINIMNTNYCLFTFTIYLAIYFFFKHEKSLKANILFSLFLGLTFWMEIEFFTIILVFLFYMFFTRSGWKKYLQEISIVLLVIFGRLLFSRIYYGDWIPNIIVARYYGLPLYTAIKNGMVFVYSNLLSLLPLLIIASACVIFFYGRKYILLFLLFLTSLLYAIVSGGDSGYFIKNICPFIPLLFILTLGFFKDLGKKYRLRKWQLDILIHAAFVISIFMLNKNYIKEALLRETIISYEDNTRNVRRAVAINEIMTMDAKLGLTWIGVLPYYSERYTIDFLGRTDRRIARLMPDISGKYGFKGMNSIPGYNKIDMDYSLLKLKPDFATLGWGRHDFRKMAKDHYIPIIYKLTLLYVKKESPNILWDKIKPLSSFAHHQQTLKMQAVCLDLKP
ncbi:MAG: hypothetical protein JXA60_00460 [Candidatus Coatesbacteria bacterium]|nr:hypothetical protein [Candidatus Coatesbacteria bacterium]